MRNINWKVRICNKNFWITFIPAVLLLVQTVASLFGFQLELSGISAQLIDIVNSAFVVLAIIGVVSDPTTPGLGDSKLAQTYITPGKLK